ncbi:unnamed protein product [Choristocarpus tenellus]
MKKDPCNSEVVLTVSGKEGSVSEMKDERLQSSIEEGEPLGLLWSDFGGSRECGDADAEETASREFAEESLGLFNGVCLNADSVKLSQVSYVTSVWISYRWRLSPSSFPTLREPLTSTAHRNESLPTELFVLDSTLRAYVTYAFSNFNKTDDTRQCSHSCPYLGTQHHKYSFCIPIVVPTLSLEQHCIPPISRKQAAMEVQLRDPTLRGTRVFKCRNGGYVMFVANVQYVPDMMLQLARKEVVERGLGEGGDGKGLCEKTDFAWVPASSLLEAMQRARHRSTRGVVVQLGGCRYLRLFHKVSSTALVLIGIHCTH